MTEERFKTWLTFTQFVLGTVVVGIVSTIINHQIQTREIEIKEQESNAKLLEQALQEDIGVRRRLAQYFSHVTRSDELRGRWVEYSKIIESEYQDTLKEKQRLQAEADNKALDLEARQKLEQKIAALEQELSPKPAKAMNTEARTYVHFAKEEQRSLAQSIAKSLREESIMVPGIQLQKSSPSRSELRYFRNIEKIEAEGIAATIRSIRPDVEARYIPGYENSTGIRPRHFELWLGSEENL